MRKCPSCSSDNSDDTKYCRSCGKEITATVSPVPLIKCPKCNSINPPSTKYCGRCGQPLTQEAADQMSREKTPLSPKKNNGCATAFIVIFGVLGIIIIGCIIIISISSYLDKNSGTSSTAGARVTTAAVTVKTPKPTIIQTPAETSTIIIDINIEDLLAAYEENEIAAQKKYDGKVLRVTGVVVNIGENVLNEVYVTLGDGSDEWNTLYCTFKSETEINKVATLKKGDELTVVGTIENGTLTLYLNNCSI